MFGSGSNRFSAGQTFSKNCWPPTWTMSDPHLTRTTGSGQRGSGHGSTQGQCSSNLNHGNTRSYCVQINVHINNSHFFTDCHHQCHHMPTNDLKTRWRHTKSWKWLDRRTSHHFNRCLRQEVTAKIFTNSGSEGRSRIVWLVHDLAMDFEWLRMSVSIRDVYMEQTGGLSE